MSGPDKLFHRTHVMASASASADGSAPAVVTADQGQVIIGIDPGPVNCGECTIRVTGSEMRVEKLKRIQFREPGSDTSDFGAGVIDAVTQWVADHAHWFANGEIIFIENQRPDACTRGTRTGQANDFLRVEALAVQHAFMTLFGRERCIVVAPHAVKARYSQHFPRVPDYNTPRGRAAQYRADKRNAVLAGRELTPAVVRNRYEEKNPKKKDDAYDALFIAKYGADFFLDEFGNVRDKPVKSKRRTNEERPHTAKKRRIGKVEADKEPKKKKSRKAAPKKRARKA